MREILVFVLKLLTIPEALTGLPETLRQAEFLHIKAGLSPHLHKNLLMLINTLIFHATIKLSNLKCYLCFCFYIFKNRVWTFINTVVVCYGSLYAC